MKHARFWMLAASAVLVGLMLLVVLVWPDVLDGLGGQQKGPQTGENTTLASTAPAFAQELGGALSDERRAEMEALVAEYAEPEQFDVADGACVRCHEDTVPYDEGADLETVLRSMAEMHEAALGPEQTAEILAYFTGYRP